MSDATTPRLKVSREGLALIKSFEGFRPRAVPGPDGRWVIGYGHTAAAREGLSVTEADAELLLQYDLLPVVKALNESVPGLNQHQFDALASFAVSVGLERFRGSDVFQRLNERQPALAADALLGWPVPPSPENRFRRRAAERALFNADPAAPVGVAELMAAPLPFPAQLEQSDPDVAAAGLPDEDPPSPFPAAADGEAASSTVHAEAAAPDAPEEPVVPVLRHETETTSGHAADRAGAGPFLIIGAAGLAACAGAAAAFRLAVEQLAPVGETLVLAWALALVGVICVGVSSWNLYQRWGRPD